MSKSVEVGIVENYLFLELFDCEILSIMGNDGEQIMEYLEDRWGYLDTDDDIKGLTDMIPSIEHTLCFFTVFVREHISPGLISHESYHVVKRLTNYLGIKDEETNAYLLDWLVDKQHGFYKKELLSWYKK